MSILALIAHFISSCTGHGVGPNKTIKQARAHQFAIVQDSSLAVLAVLTISLSVVSSSYAQGADDSADQAAAEALFEQGQALIANEDYDAACEKLRASQELDQGLGTLLYLADCYEKAGKLASAWGRFAEAASLAESRQDEKRAQVASIRASALRPRLSHLLIVSTESPPDGFEVRRNGRIISPATFDVAIPVDAGTWTLSVTAPGYQVAEVQVQVEADADEPYRVSLPTLHAMPSVETTHQASASPPAEATAELTTDSPTGNQRTLAYIVGSIGVAGTLASGIFSVLALSANSDSESGCVNNGCTSKGLAARDDAIDLANLATIGGVIGGLGLAGGATLYFTAPAHETSALTLGVSGSW